MGFFDNPVGRIVAGAATMGGSETLRAIQGKDSVYDPLLDAAGLGIPDVGPRPDADAAFSTPEATAAENLRRAYALQEQAGQFTTRGMDIRDPNIVAQTVRPERVGEMTSLIERAQAGTINAPRSVSTPYLGDVQRVEGRQVGAAELADAVQTGPAERTAATRVQQADRTSQAEALLQAAARGDQPSKAEALLQAGLDKASKKQRGMAAAARGSERRGARRAAMLGIGEQGAEVAQQAAAIRADEMARARGDLAQFEQQTRSLQQQALSLQAQIDAAAARGDADAVNRLRGQQADISSELNRFNAAARNARASENVALMSRADELNAAARNARDADRARLILEAETGNVGRELQANVAGAGLTTTANLANAAAAQRRQEQQQATAEANAARQLQADLNNQQAGLSAATSTSQLQQAADIANINRMIQEQQTRQAGQLGGMGAAATAGEQQTSIAGTKYGADMAEYNAEVAAADAARQQRLGLVQTGINIAAPGAGTALGAGLKSTNMNVNWGNKQKGGPPAQEDEEFELSDERKKTDIEPVDDKAAIKLADAYRKSVSTYKRDDGDGRTTAGVMAQDLQRDPLGKLFVAESDDGTLSVNYGGLNAVVLKGLAAKLDAQAQRTAKGRRA